MIQKRLVAVTAVLVALLLLAAPLTALAQEPLTQEFISDTGLSFSYPENWTVQQEFGMVALSNDPTAFEAENLPAGALGLIVVEPSAVSMLVGDEQGMTPEEMITSLAGELSGGAVDSASLVPEQLALGDRSALQVEFSALTGDLTNDVLLLVVDLGEENNAVVIALTSSGGLDSFKDTILAIAGSMEFVAPWHAMFLGHTDYVNGVAFSPDGAQLVSASDDYTARVWDVASGTEVLNLEHPNYVYSAAFSPDGAQIVTGCADGIVRVWDAASGASVAELAGHTDYVRGAVFSPDGSLIASASDDGSVRVWAFTDGWQEQSVLSGHTDYVRSVAFSPDGTRIVSGSDDLSARVWDVASGAELVSVAHPDWARSVAFSPDGTQIVTGSDDGLVRVWDAASGASVAELAGHTDYVNSVVFSPDGSLIASGSDDSSVRLWALDGTWQEQSVLSGHTDWVNGVAFSPDGTLVASASDDGSVMLWDVAR